MFRGPLAILAILTALALAGCGNPHYPPETDDMSRHHVSFEGI
jgi:predicted small lipoprotein YifL